MSGFSFWAAVPQCNSPAAQTIKQCQWLTLMRLHFCWMCFNARDVTLSHGTHNTKYRVHFYVFASWRSICELKKLQKAVLALLQEKRRVEWIDSSKVALSILFAPQCSVGHWPVWLLHLMLYRWAASPENLLSEKGFKIVTGKARFSSNI